MVSSAAGSGRSSLVPTADSLLHALMYNGVHVLASCYDIASKHALQMEDICVMYFLVSSSLVTSESRAVQPTKNV